MKNSKVTIPHVSNLEYYEYIYTGFHNLYREGSIHDFKINYSRLQARWQKTLNKIIRKKVEDDWLSSEINIVFADKKLSVALDVRDTPWEFDEELLERCDLYFKYQCPVDYEQGFYRLNEQNIFHFNELIKRNIKKIRPIVVPRALGRKMDFNANNKILKKYAQIRQANSRKYNLLAFLGNCFDNYQYNTIHHPHIKRTQSLIYLNNMADEHIKIIYRRPSQKEFADMMPNGHEKLPTAGKVSDQEYFALCAESKATLNIAGLRGSIPFRFMDAFLSGMLIITDTPLVKWYIPLRNGLEIYDIGSMAYEILTTEQFDNRMKKLRDIMADVDEIRKRNLEHQNQFYETYLAPEKIGLYILRECEKIV